MRENFLYRPNCELCGSEEKIILFSKEFIDRDIWSSLELYYESRINRDDLAGGRYEVAKCSDCGFIWQTNILNEEMAGRLYGEWISPEKSLAKKQGADISLFYGYARGVQKIFSLLPARPREIDVLDFGMGWGLWCQMAKAFGCKVRGFEISEDRIEFAKKNGIDVIDTFSGIASYKFDFINAEQVFEHISDLLRTLKFLAANLKNGGVVRISVPDGRNVERRLKNSGWSAAINPILPLEHINCFTHRTLIRLGELADLMPAREPSSWVCGYDLKSCFRGVFGGFYKRYFGTTLYFRKKA